LRNKSRRKKPLAVTNSKDRLFPHYNRGHRSSSGLTPFVVSLASFSNLATPTTPAPSADQAAAAAKLYAEQYQQYTQQYQAWWVVG
jgi:hypothetical protein